MLPSELAAFYCVYADRCIELAPRISDPSAKATMLNMAQAWLVLADQAGKWPKSETPKQAVQQQQQQQQPQPDWRDRAARMRMLAEETKDAESKVIMLRLADDYDKLADRVARRMEGEPKAP
jgi:hypothetical protein